MKILILCLMFCWSFSASAQIKFDDATRETIYLEMVKSKVFPKEKWVDKNVILYTEPNFYIWNLLTMERITDTEYVSEQFGIYSINTIKNHKHILLINDDRYTIIEMSFLTYEQIIEKVLKYFRKNPEVDKRLLPLYIQKITLIDLSNHARYDDYGPWRKWFDKNTTDSIALKYRDYLYLGRDN